MKKAIFGARYGKQYQRYKQNPFQVYNKLKISLRDNATKEDKEKIFNQFVKDFGVNKASLEYYKLFGVYYGEEE